MAETQTLDYTSYESPEAIASDGSITHTQKMSMLGAWADDILNDQRKADSSALAEAKQAQSAKVRKLMEELEQYGK
ncbi:MAG: hypothetical protein HKN36_01825 [Hellea sp.]|nr:hypothetical protein [Hellea sp.]